MSESIEIRYYGKGYSKGKNGTQKIQSGVLIGSGAVLKGWFNAKKILKNMGYPVDKHPWDIAIEEEAKRLKTRLKEEDEAWAKVLGVSRHLKN